MIATIIIMIDDSYDQWIDLLDWSIDSYTVEFDWLMNRLMTFNWLMLLTTMKWSTIFFYGMNGRTDLSINTRSANTKHNSSTQFCQNSHCNTHTVELYFHNVDMYTVLHGTLFQGCGWVLAL